MCLYIKLLFVSNLRSRGPMNNEIVFHLIQEDLRYRCDPSNSYPVKT